MHVLHVHDRWSTLGGADWHMFCLLDLMPGGIRSSGVFGRSDGSVDEALPSSSPSLSLEKHFIKKLDKKAPFAAENNVGQKLKALIDDLAPDVIHVHNIVNPHLMNVLAETDKAMISVQDHRFFCPGRGKVRENGDLCKRPFSRQCLECFEDSQYFERLMELVEARTAILHKFQAIVVLSNYMKEELVRVGLDGDRIHVIPPFVHGLEPVDTPPSSAEAVMFAARIVWAKGIFDFLDALAMLDNPPVKAIIAGQGTIEETVNARVAELKLEDRIEFTGWTPHRKMPELFRRARVVVMPSRWQEPFGITGLEGQWSGRPVVAYDGGGIRDWLEDPVTGIIIPPGNDLALAAAINTMVKEPELADEIGEAAKRHVLENFRPEALMEKLVGVYRSLYRAD